MSSPERKICNHCSREIAADARICPFCGADPDSGVLDDQEESRLVRETLLAESEKESQFAEFLRENRQILLILALLVGIGALLGVTAMMSGGDAREVESVPLSELTSLPDEPDEEGRILEMPEPDFSIPGDPSTFETWVTEQGEEAPTPEEIAAEEQSRARRAAAAAAARRQQEQAAQPGTSATESPEESAPIDPSSGERDPQRNEGLS